VHRVPPRIARSLQGDRNEPEFRLIGSGELAEAGVNRCGKEALDFDLTGGVDLQLSYAQQIFQGHRRRRSRTTSYRRARA
jgi:hypothetical protein